MPKRSSKPKQQDENFTAFSIVQKATSENQPKEPTKNPHAVSLGRLGGLKGGPARARKLSSQKRKDIARKAALSRWSKQ